MFTYSMTPINMPYRVLDSPDVAMYYSSSLNRPVYTRYSPVQDLDHETTGTFISNRTPACPPRKRVEPACRLGGLRYPRSLDPLGRGNRARREARVTVVKQRSREVQGLSQSEKQNPHEKQIPMESKSKCKAWVNRILRKLDCRRL